MSLLFSIVWQIFMEGVTPQQRLQIVQAFYENQCSVKSVFCVLRGIYCAHHRHVSGPIDTSVKNCRIWADEQLEEFQELALHL